MNVMQYDDCHAAEHALLVMVFYENKRNAAAALRQFHRLKSLRKGLFLLQDLERAITRFKKTEHLEVQSGRRRKPVH